MDKQTKNSTRLKKASRAGAGKFSYKYTELADINAYLDEQGLSYYQYTEFCEPANVDYIYTVVVGADGKESAPRRGVQIIAGGAGQSAAQQQGSGVTYARRYSLLMALGLATEDDDGASAGPAPATKPAEGMPSAGAPSDKQIGFLASILDKLGFTADQKQATLEKAKASTSKEVSAGIQKYQKMLEEKGVTR